jgi:hypothetical protein
VRVSGGHLHSLPPAHMLRFLVEEGQAALSRVDPVGVSCLCFGSFVLIFGLYSRVRTVLLIYPVRDN